MKTIHLLMTCSLFFLFGCVSTPNALDLVEEREASTSLTDSAQYQSLHNQLKGLGYEAVGLEYESDSTLALLTRVFEDPRTAGRKIKLVYTGLHMTYDSKAQSVTLGGTFEPREMILFIESNVPKNP